MKKALTLVILIVTPSIIFAAGSVAFQNQTGLVQQWTSSYDSTLAPVPVGGGYVQLIAAPAGTSLQPLGVYEGSLGFVPGFSSLAGFLAANQGWVAPLNGYWTGPQGPVPVNFLPGIFNGGVAILPNIAGGAEADYVVIGWTGPYATYDAAYAADLASPNSSFLGTSAIARTRTGDLDTTNPGLAVSLRPTFQGMTLAPAVIPEPTTVLLAGLGAVLLLLFRRRG